MWYKDDCITPGDRPSNGLEKAPYCFDKGNKTILDFLNEIIFKPFIFMDRRHYISLTEGVIPINASLQYNIRKNKRCQLSFLDFLYKKDIKPFSKPG